jgi:hypothetical protein
MSRRSLNILPSGFDGSLRVRSNSGRSGSTGRAKSDERTTLADSLGVHVAFQPEEEHYMTWFWEMICHVTLHRWKNLVRKRDGAFVPDTKTYCLRCGLRKDSDKYERKG